MSLLEKQEVATCMHKTFVSMPHCALENEADLYVNESQKIRHYRVKSIEERRRKKKKKNTKSRFFTLLGAYVNCAIIAMLYIPSIGNLP